MEIKRFFASKSSLVDNIFTIEGEEFIHLTKVLRHKVGYHIIVCINDNKDYHCTITKIDRDYCLAQVDKVEDNICVSRSQITLFQALPKSDKMDLIIQKSVELGVNNIVPFYSKYVNESKFNKERAIKISLEASKQCGRATKCLVSDVVEFEIVEKMIDSFDLVIMPYENAEQGRIGNIPDIKTAQNIAIIIGSEGGFCEQEVDSIIAKSGVVVSLGKRILRCETAAIVATAIVRYEQGDLQ